MIVISRITWELNDISPQTVRAAWQNTPTFGNDCGWSIEVMGIEMCVTKPKYEVNDITFSNVHVDGWRL